MESHVVVYYFDEALKWGLLEINLLLIIYTYDSYYSLDGDFVIFC